MKYIVRIHYYLGVFFAPLLLFFTVSGAWQLFNLHKARKDGSYTPPELIVKLSRIHQDQKGFFSENSSELFRYFSCVMAAGLVALAVLGVVIALRRYPGRQRWITAGCLALGVVVPALMVL